MKLPTVGREFYRIRPNATLHGTPVTGLQWEADFGNGFVTPDQTEDGWLMWLCAGPLHAATEDPAPAFQRIAQTLAPVVRSVDNPEVIYRDAPKIILTTVAA